MCQPASPPDRENLVKRLVRHHDRQLAGIGGITVWFAQGDGIPPGLGPTAARLMMPIERACSWRALRWAFPDSLRNTRSDSGVRLATVLESGHASLPWDCSVLVCMHAHAQTHACAPSRPIRIAIMPAGVQGRRASIDHYPRTGRMLCGHANSRVI